MMHPLMIKLFYGGPVTGTRSCDCMKGFYWCDCYLLKETDMTECYDCCEPATAKDPRIPPLSEDICLCHDCCTGAWMERVGELGDDLEQAIGEASSAVGMKHIRPIADHAMDKIKRLLA